MGEEAKTPKKNFFKGVKNEFRKISWPDKQSIFRSTVAVVTISVVLGVVIKVFDMLIQFALNLIM